MKKIAFGILGILVSFIVTSHKNISTSEKSGCELLHEGTFVYGDLNSQVKVEIKGKKHTEFHNNGKYVIKSKLNWVNDCEYNMTMTKITIPNFPYGVGDVMNVKVDSIKEKVIYYTSTVKGRSWKGMLLKVK